MTQLATFVVVVSNVEASIVFYCKFLGFIIAYDWHKAGEERIVRLRNKDYNIHLSLQLPLSDWEQQPAGKQSGNYPYITLEVSDLEQHYNALVQNRAPLTRDLVSTLFGNFAYLTDPDGNKICLSEYWVDA
ncbi:VOC family protein [Hymenobacter sp. BT635]|uniref:VOC family protein n=1 Tax=Hymenobacter nitidus TaxID=2880929 RepID=A0ABS8AAI4_9BACT|nr:VOC family protein [Hymenobacter nitidus]MCB2377402.1 VOC family protein [Hymenobacter nitidus]